MRASRFASGVGLSETAAVDEKVRILRGEGREIVNLGVGQPDLPTPAAINEAGIRAIQEGHTRYTSPVGTLELREAVTRKLADENDVRYTADEILVSSGSKHAIHNLLAAVLNPGEEVLLPTPTWVSYPAMIRLLGGRPRFVETSLEGRFRLTPEALRRALGPKVVGLVLNTPCNPTGAVYGGEELVELAAVIRQAGLWVITDEIYEAIVFDESRHVSLLAAEAALRDRIAMVSGVSKSFSMTGWRIGYAAGPQDWIRTAASIQSHQAGNACSISQEAARHALLACRAQADAMRATFQQRRDLSLQYLGGVDGLELFRPEGTFYLFPRVRRFLGRRGAKPDLVTDVDLVAWLLDETGVATIPGTAFAAPDHIRISFAVSDAVLAKGLGALRDAFERLGPVPEGQR